MYTLCVYFLWSVREKMMKLHYWTISNWLSVSSQSAIQWCNIRGDITSTIIAHIHFFLKNNSVCFNDTWNFTFHIFAKEGQIEFHCLSLARLILFHKITFFNFVPFSLLEIIYYFVVDILNSNSLLSTI